MALVGTKVKELRKALGVVGGSAPAAEAGGGEEEEEEEEEGGGGDGARRRWTRDVSIRLDMVP
jgi:hypothetical protein